MRFRVDDLHALAHQWSVEAPPKCRRARGRGVFRPSGGSIGSAAERLSFPTVAWPNTDSSLGVRTSRNPRCQHSQRRRRTRKLSAPASRLSRACYVVSPESRLASPGLHRTLVSSSSRTSYLTRNASTNRLCSTVVSHSSWQACGSSPAGKSRLSAERLACREAPSDPNTAYAAILLRPRRFRGEYATTKTA